MNPTNLPAVMISDCNYLEGMIRQELGGVWCKRQSWEIDQQEKQIAGV